MKKLFQFGIALLLVSIYALAQHGQHGQPSDIPLVPANSPSKTTEHNHNTHEDEYGVSLSYAELKTTVDQLHRIREVTAKYRDLNVAQADGYRLFGPDIAGMGIHYVKDTDPKTFELDNPPILLYEKDPSARAGYSLVGVAYLLNAAEGPDGQPVTSPFSKSLAMWHRHAHICMFKEGGHTSTLTEDQCQKRGGNFVAQSQWMIHAWVWKDSPSGVFSAMNPRVSGGVAMK